jgi:S-adenosylmethionine decarboxylase
MKGQHLIVDIKECKRIDILNNVEKCMELFDTLCVKYKFNVLNRSYHKFEPQGISVLYFLSESHLACHPWPEKGFISLDCYTCSDDITFENHKQLYDDLLTSFQGKELNFIIMDRSFDTDNIN